MTNNYRLLLLEDDKTFSGSLYQALNKQSQYPRPVEVRTFSYKEFELQFSEARNSSREIIVLGGRESLNYEPDTSLLQQLAGKQERTHFFLLTPVLEGKRLLQLCAPQVSGITERSELAQTWLPMAIKRIQRRQQARSSQNGKMAEEPMGFFQQIRAAVFSFFV